MRLQNFWISVLNLLGLSAATPTPPKCIRSWSNWISKSRGCENMKEIVSEKYLERTLSEKLNKCGYAWSIKLLSTFVRGLPDRLILCKGGYVCFAEIKTTGKKPTAIQKFIHEQLNKLGFTVFIVDTKESMNEVLEHVKNKSL